MRTTVRNSAIWSFVVALALWGASGIAAQEWREVTGESFSFTEVRPGVWHVTGTGAIAVGSNGALVEGERDLLLVDSHMTPAAARALLADLPQVTDKPIRYVVNTHFHFDHVQGNQVFGPEVEIIAHEETRRRVADGDSRRGRGYDYFIGGLPERIAQLEAELPGLEGDARAEAEERLAGMRTLLEQDRETELAAPTLALRQAVTLFRDGREIRILYLGRGHTSGDVVVYLPAEKALVTGDLLTGGVPYMGDGFLPEWVETLEALRGLEIDVVLPGHGRAFGEPERIVHLQELLRDLWEQCVDQHARGVPAAEAAAAIDLTAHSEHFPTIEGPGVMPHAVERAYELLDER